MLTSMGQQIDHERAREVGVDHFVDEAISTRTRSSRCWKPPSPAEFRATTEGLSDLELPGPGQSESDDRCFDLGMNIAKLFFVDVFGRHQSFASALRSSDVRVV